MAKRRASTDHLRAWPTRAMRREGGTMVTSWDRPSAMCARRFSLDVSPYKSLQPTPLLALQGTTQSLGAYSQLSW